MVWPQHWFVKFSNLLPHSGWIANPNLPLFSPTCHLFIHRGLDHLGLETVRGTWVISSALSPSSVYSHIVSFHRNWPSMKEGTCNSCNMTSFWSDPVHTRSSPVVRMSVVMHHSSQHIRDLKKSPVFVSICRAFFKDLKRPSTMNLYEFRTYSIQCSECSLTCSMHIALHMIKLCEMGRMWKALPR